MFNVFYCTCMDSIIKPNEQHTVLLKDFGTTCKPIQTLNLVFDKAISHELKISVALLLSQWNMIETNCIR